MSESVDSYMFHSVALILIQICELLFGVVGLIKGIAHFCRRV